MIEILPKIRTIFESSCRGVLESSDMVGSLFGNGLLEFVSKTFFRHTQPHSVCFPIIMIDDDEMTIMGCDTSGNIRESD